jgi:DNA polymerase-3 subunit delta
MFGGSKVVRATAGRRITAAALQPLLDGGTLAATLIVEAGNLKPTDAMRTLFEKSAQAAAVACYADEAADLEGLIRETLKASGLTITSDAREMLVARMGADRVMSRGEIEKLALYVGAGNEATIEDAKALVGDSADIGLDDLVDATAGGDAVAVARAYDKLTAEGLPAIAILRAAQRHFVRLHLCAGMIAAGQDADSAMMRLRPPVFWKQKDAFRGQLRRWPVDRLTQALERLLDAEIACKSTGSAADTLASRCLFELSQAGSARAGR